MKKKMITGLIAFAFACSSLFLMVSCAKKQVQVSEGVQPTTEEAKEAEKARPEEVKKAEVTDLAKEEAARKARLEEIKLAQRLAEEVRVFESQNIYFDFDKSDLKPPAKAILKKKADWLRRNPSYRVRIEGHCDERGTNEYNLALGERRAYSAKKFLAALGISEKRMPTISWGEERPADPGHNEAAWSKNRRDEFKLIR